MNRLYCEEKLFCQRCRTNRQWRQAMKAPEICPENVIIVKKIEESNPCIGCKWEVLGDYDAQGCKLIGDGKPCALHRFTGPWPEGCRRRK